MERKKKGVLPMQYEQYGDWAEEYLQEAEHLKSRVEALRSEARTVRSREEADRLIRRAGLLYDMYLDCMHTGRFLRRCERKGKRRSAA